MLETYRRLGPGIALRPLRIANHSHDRGLHALQCSFACRRPGNVQCYQKEMLLLRATQVGLSKSLLLYGLFGGSCASRKKDQATFV